MTTYILGGGPAGLALAVGLVEANKGPIVLIEAQPQPGGMAQTVAWGSHGRHDLGPHKLYSTDPLFLSRVLDLLPVDQWIHHPKTSRVYLGGRFLPYPPSPTSLVRLYGARWTAKMLWDYWRAPGGSGASFENDLIRRVGPTLYETLFRPMAWKIWGDPARCDGQLARDRVRLPTVSDWVRRQVGRAPKNTSEATSFRYPRGGLQTLWTAMDNRVGRNGRQLYSHRVVRLEGDPHRITAITAQHGNDTTRFEVGKGDFVFSTLPLGLLGSLFPGLGSSVIDDVRAATPAHDLVLVFLKLKGPAGYRLMQEGWVFVPDSSIPFHRVSEIGAFDPDLVPQGSILCCEIMGGPHRPDNTLSDAEHTAQAVDGLRRMGYLFDVEDTRVIRLNSSYPVPTEASQSKRDRVLAFLDDSTNWKAVGRSGAFQYIGTLDALDIGFGAARWLANGAHPASWKQERLRTAHYPIYD